MGGVVLLLHVPERCGQQEAVRSPLREAALDRSGRSCSALMLFEESYATVQLTLLFI